MATTTHPAFCAPARCRDTGADVVHASTAITIPALDGALALTLVRCDERDPDGQVEHPAEARLAPLGGVAHLDRAGVAELRAALERVEACMAEEENRRAAR